jgi:2-oxoisovalerate dehydrogenase E2 component (dihydrolipoyl transacylase)
VSGTTVPDFCLPDLGEGLTEAEITSWRVQVGDEVGTDQVVVEVETAKAAVEVPVPFAGRVTALHAREGQVVPVGAPLISVTPASTAAVGAAGSRGPGVVVPPARPATNGPSAAGPAPDGTLAAARPAPAAGTAAAPEPSGSVLVGYGTPAGSARRRRHVRPRRPAPPPPAGPSELPALPAPQRRHGGGRVPVISPLVRKVARDSGVDLSALTGSGPSGLVLRRDVEQAILRRGPAPSAPRLGSGGELRIPLRGARKAAADKLTRSRREIPEATVWVDVDATDLLAARAVMNERQPERPVSILALVARFAVLGLRRYPELNGRVEADEIVLPAGVQLGFAAQTSRGLVVPVVRDAHLMSARDLSAAIAELTAAARAATARPADLSGGTFTVNNYGVFGVDGSAAIINHPEVAILGLGRIIDRPWVVDGAIAVRKLAELTLAFDHRVCDGATAGGFLRFVADCIESPASALADL